MWSKLRWVDKYRDNCVVVGSEGSFHYISDKISCVVRQEECSLKTPHTKCQMAVMQRAHRCHKPNRLLLIECFPPPFTV